MAEWMPVLVAQTWQVTLLIVAVAAINRWAGKTRPHLAHALWLVVLVKCVTPPVWSSPSGLFCWLQPARETMREPLAVEPAPRNWSDLVASARRSQSAEVVHRDDALVQSDVEPEEMLLGFDESSTPVPVSSMITSGKVDWPCVLFGAWVLASLVVITVAVVRWLRCWRMLRNAPRRECAELSAQLELLAKQLGLRRRVRLIVTESRLGPAVIGLFRTTVLLPALIVDRLSERSDASSCLKTPHPACRGGSRDFALLHSCEPESSAESREPPGQARWGEGRLSPLAPILAHELLHIRRGDLWVGLLQTLAQAVWWCHPLVWWVNRRTTREAERCCDEEVLAELGCDPAAYARALVDVLELKRELKPVPVFPGVRPVEVTSQRLERIMQLGQGCQRRTPWWCWLLAGLAAAATWPGAAFVVTAEDEIPLAQTADRAIDLDKEPKLGLAYRVRVIRGAEEDLRPLVQKFNDKLLEKPGALVVVEHDELLRLLKEAQTFPRLKLTSHPVATGRGREKVSIADVSTYAVPVEVTAADGTTKFVEQSQEHGWRLTMQPLTVGIESLRLRVENNLIRLCKDADAKIRFPVTGEERLIPGLDLHVIKTTVDLKHAQHLVFPVTKVPNADSQDVMLVMMQACLVVLDEASQQPVPTPNVLESSIRRGIGVNSDAGVTGEVVLEESADPIRVGNIAEILVEGNLQVPTHEILAMIKSKVGEPVYEKQMRADVRAIYSSRQFISVTPRLLRADQGVKLLFQVAEGPQPPQVPDEVIQPVKSKPTPADHKIELDGLGQLLWQHGSWFIVVRPEPGAKLVESVDAPATFESNGAVRVMMTQMQIEGFDRKNQISVSADTFTLTTNEHGQHMRLTGGGKMSGHEFDATADRIQLTLVKSPDFEGHDISASLTGKVTLWRKSKGQVTEMSAEKALFVVRGSSIAQLLGHDKNGVTAVLRQPPELDEKLVQRHQQYLERTPVEKRISVHFDSVPLKAALQQVAKASDRNIHIDKAGLADEGLTDTTLVTLNLEQVKLSSALNLLLEPLNLGYRVEESGVIVVTSQQRLKGQLIVLTYSVADLTVPIPKRVVVKLAADRSVTGDQSKPSAPAKSMPLQIHDLVDLITSTCQPNSWEEVGGNGHIKANDSTLSLVVRQTRDVHDEIRDLLGQLRRLQQTQVALQIETWTVPDDFWERLRKLDVDLQDYPLPDRKSPAEVLALLGFPTNRFQLPVPNPPADAPLLRLAVLLRKEAKLLGSVCQTKLSPKFTLHNGQELELIDGLYSPPTRLILKPVLSDELKRLRLHAAVMKPGDVEPDAKPDFTKCAVALDAGQAILLDALPQEFSVVEEKSTTLSLNGITTKSLGKRNVNAAHRTLLLITGQVVVVEEEEVRLGIPK